MDKYEQLRMKTIEKCIPLNLDWELTYRCNISCKHCYQCGPTGEEEVDFKTVCSTLDQLAELGCLFITFTGGEILLREDIFDILKYARSKGFAYRFFTNGLLVDDEVVKKLRAASPLSVEISLYAMTAEIHDGVTGLNGSFNKTVSAIKKLREVGLNVKIKTTIIKDNYKEFKKIENFAKETGCGFVYYLSIVNKINGDNSVCALNISEEQLKEMYTEHAWELERGLENRRRSGYEPICSAGTNSIYISPYGDVRPCVLLKHHAGNVKTEKVKDIWNSDTFDKDRKVKFSDVKQCSECNISIYCNRCAGEAELEHGDWLGPSDRACTLAKVRAELVGLSGPAPATYKGEING